MFVFPRHVQERVVKILKSDNKKLPDDRKVSLLRATTMHEVDHLVSFHLVLLHSSSCIYPYDV